MTNQNKKSAAPMSADSAKSLQMVIFDSSSQLQALRRSAGEDQNATAVIDGLMENAQIYAMLMEEIMTPSIQRSEKDNASLPVLIKQITEHCQSVEDAFNARPKGADAKGPSPSQPNATSTGSQHYRMLKFHQALAKKKS